MSEAEWRKIDKKVQHMIRQQSAFACKHGQLMQAAEQAEASQFTDRHPHTINDAHSKQLVLEGACCSRGGNDMHGSSQHQQLPGHPLAKQRTA